MADLEAVLADVSYLMAMEKSKCTPAARASKKIILPDPRYVTESLSLLYHSAISGGCLLVRFDTGRRRDRPFRWRIYISLSLSPRFLPLPSLSLPPVYFPCVLLSLSGSAPISLATTLLKDVSRRLSSFRIVSLSLASLPGKKNIYVYKQPRDANARYSVQGVFSEYFYNSFDWFRASKCCTDSREIIG